jgi:hypothetical protein
MRRWVLLATTLAGFGCGGPPQVPLAIQMSALTATDLGEIQISLLSPASKYDCAVVTTDCVKHRYGAAEPVQLTGTDGNAHPAQLFELTANPSGQTLSVTGIPPTHSVVVVVEGVTKDHQLGASSCVFVDQITDGANPALAVTLELKAAPVSCDPRF